MLSYIYPHERDQRICFQDEGHLYTIDGKTDYTSTTTFIKKFFPEFDADAIIQKMKISGSFDKKYAGKTAEQVKQEWKASGRQASEKGTKLHLFIENYFNGETQDAIPQGITQEVEYFYDFLKKVKPTAHRTEWYIFDEKYKIAGSIDFVCQLPSGELVIYDWKCSKEIKHFNRFEKGKYPVQDMDNCNGNYYALQLNVYKYILEEYYGKRVAEMNLIVLHHNNEGFISIPVPDLRHKVKAMLETLKKERVGSGIPLHRVG